MTSSYQAGLRVKVLPRFPARVETGNGLAVAKANGVYSFALDFETLTPATQIDDVNDTWVPVWLSDDDSYQRMAASAFGGAIGASFSGTSASSVEVGTGSKAFTASTGRAWAVGQRLRVSDDDGANVMSGTVTAYNATTGALTIDVDYILGSGTHAAWNIVIGGEVGPEGEPGDGTGDVVGPGSATDGRFVIFDGGSGKLVKNGAGAPGALAYLGTVGTPQVDDDAITYAKMQNIATDRLLGRDTSGTGDLEALTVSGGIEFSGSGGIRRSALTGSVIASAGSNTTAIANDVVTWANLASSALASQGDAEAGTATNKFMSPERVKQAIVALAPGGGLTLLDDGTVSNAATLDLVLTSYTGYRGLIIELIRFIPATDNVELHCRVSTNGGSSYDAGASDYQWEIVQGISLDGDVEPQIVLAQGVGFDATEGVSLTVKIMDQTNTGVRPFIVAQGLRAGTTGNTKSVFATGRRSANQDTDAIRFQCSSGNIASGKYAIYGLI